MNVHHLLNQYGYAAVFALVGAESLGIPLPGETILIAAALYAGSTHKLSVTGSGPTGEREDIAIGRFSPSLRRRP